MGGRNSNLRKATSLISKRRELEAVRAKRIEAEERLKAMKEQVELQNVKFEKDRNLALRKLEDIQKIQGNLNAAVDEVVKSYESLGENLGEKYNGRDTQKPR
mmetsp:Transcript_2955/g.3375  ORF Transcript_2955/g.3375 Transcript_2955/m.3375 type:complete len:102 (-) Transcript_2955:304-609(-)|eukprot:CAMPEP_0184016938 /NCGR_PEP_ID=MMETSP0954-20121128/7219_1 /TAXON_ID=627963 /ORGANISM="Aplanochytrium sp, Strain PBS07" /LENGTH=101 /DNA_ID=CAMNT_0026298039 /DNA_START=171 /DNA_END=476 /DNA_ORIENTATION=-